MLFGIRGSLEYANAAGYSISLKPVLDFSNATAQISMLTDSLATDMQKEKSATRHGEILSRLSLGVRNIELTGFINNNKTAIENFIKAFNPALTGILTYNDGYKKYDLNCLMNAKAELSPNGAVTGFNLALSALFPLWQGEEHTEDIAHIEDRWEWPWAFPENGFIFGSVHGNLKHSFYNLGDVETGAIYRLYCAQGSVTNPCLTQVEQNSRIKFNYTLQEREELLITSTPVTVSAFIKHVDGTQESAIPYLIYDDARSFFLLDVGLNTIAYDADENVLNLQVFVNYSPLYVEVLP